VVVGTGSRWAKPSWFDEAVAFQWKISVKTNKHASSSEKRLASGKRVSVNLWDLEYETVQLTQTVSKFKMMMDLETPKFSEPACQALKSELAKTNCKGERKGFKFVSQVGEERTRPGPGLCVCVCVCCVY
jgi:hypothetical protein